ncbi:MAG: GYD domain-containing protein [Acidobacteria bacterium]|nr:GYD domain-containing protein [Acidobacteriota bacterium]
MPQYLFQVGYTAEAWKALVKKPQNRLEAIRPVIEKLGGKIHDFWFCFGEYDIVGVIEAPDNVSAAAFAIGAAAGGALRSFKTTPLMSVAEGLEALKRAGKAGYQPPS